jgi:ribosome biogenesis GTPase
MEQTATVLTGRNNIFTVRLGQREYLCRIKGKNLKLEERVYNPCAPGDRVLIEQIDEEQGTAVIAERLPRSNEFTRLNRKREVPQTLGANLDLVAVLASTRLPAFRPTFVDRVLAIAHFYGIEAALLITKSDLDPAAAGQHVHEFAEIGYPVVTTSDRDRTSVDSVASLFERKRVLLVGQSGVGKSSLVNRLAGDAVQKTGAISRRYSRGTHTTNAGLLLPLDNMELVDTPGVREVDCTLIPYRELDTHFIEFAEWSEVCAMRDCSHLHEPDCAVQSAVGRGAITARRYESYSKLYWENKEAQEARW